MNVQQDTKDIEVSSVSHIKKVHQENKLKKKKYYSNPLLRMWRTIFL